MGEDEGGGLKQRSGDPLPEPRTRGGRAARRPCYHARVANAFQPLYHADRISIVNPQGDVGLITLWSPLRTVKRKLADVAPETLDPSRSRIAAIGNLYGDGMHAMLCNLLFNPQVRHLVAVGEDLGLPTCDELRRFIEDGLQDAELLGAPMKRIVGTSRLFPATPGFQEQPLRQRLTFARLGRLSGEGFAGALEDRLRNLPRATEDSVPPRIRVQGATSQQASRPGADSPSEAGPRSHRPSRLTAHQVQRASPLRCWEELVVRAIRFGRRVELRKGPRLELLNARAVILQPQRDPGQALQARGFSLDELVDYERQILDPQLPEGISYTYGNRLRGHFRRDGEPLDALKTAIGALSANPETRHAYVSLWDNALDLPRQGAETAAASPCLVTLFFRRTQEGGLSLTATYRSHNLLTAWLRNVYGLIAIQRHVAAGCAMPAGPITVISQSLGIDPASPRYEIAKRLAKGWSSDDEVDLATGKRSLRQDPNGYFVVTLDKQAREIVVEHRFEGILIKRYSGRRAGEIANRIAGDMAVSLPSHALWLGAELARKEAMLDA